VADNQAQTGSSFSIVTVLRAERPEFGSVDEQLTYPVGTGGAFPTGNQSSEA